VAEKAARVLLVDDHTLYREGLRALFGRWDDFEIIGEAQNGQEAIKACRELQPDVVLMDVQMPGMDGVEAARRIHSEFKDIAIVMLTMTIEESSLYASIRSGARGYILKDIPARQLGDRLRGVLRGEVALSGPAAARVLDKFNQINEPGATHPDGSVAATIPNSDSVVNLSRGETEMLRLLARGLSNEEIAALLFMSEGAVKKKLSTVLHKLHIKNRVQAATYAVRNGLAD
jgi:DNA-binding NarL/FixJ family response regulator